MLKVGSFFSGSSFDEMDDIIASSSSPSLKQQRLLEKREVALGKLEQVQALLQESKKFKKDIKVSHSESENLPINDSQEARVAALEAKKKGLEAKKEQQAQRRAILEQMKLVIGK